MTTYGYARVSSKDQNLNRQLDAFAGVHIPQERIYTDRLTGSTFERPGYQQLLARLRPQDVLVVKSIDRLGRNYDEILEQWRLLTKQMNVDIRVLDMPLLDTSSSQNRGVTGTLIADIVLELLSYVAHIERDNIRQRQAEGIAAARARGVKLGRPALEIPQEFESVRTRWEQGGINSREAARALGVSHTTFLKWAHQEPCKR